LPGGPQRAVVLEGAGLGEVEGLDWGRIGAGRPGCAGGGRLRG
jgi:hypothetical protein